MVVYGYTRISASLYEDSEDSILTQKEELRKKYPNLNIYCDIHPGDTFDRPKWKILKDRLKQGDKVVVTKVEIFSKSTFLITLNEITNLRQSGIEVIILELLSKEKTFWDYVTDIYNYFENIRVNRQLLVINSIIANPLLKKEKYPGRKTFLDDDFLEELQELRNQNVRSPSVLARKLGTSRSTIYKALKLVTEDFSSTLTNNADGET
jgi:DNA invertase Pin-like site-specific DNA recombinase